MVSGMVVNVDSVHVFPLIDKEADERPIGSGSGEGPDLPNLSTLVTRGEGVVFFRSDQDDRSHPRTS